ncbi:MAG: hypothetical protein LBT89_09970 [Planctomycetaceae bacterium]|jgi:hypothetical protein|nr:hypothetical protein [Planctomycetaceae bacterium]
MQRHRRGMILFFVSIVIAMLAAAAVMLLRLTNTDSQTAALYGDRLQCDQLVFSGIAFLTVNQENVEQNKIELRKPFEVFSGGYFVIDALQNGDVKVDDVKVKEPLHRFQVTGYMNGSTVISKAAVVIDYSQSPPKVIRCIFL